MEADWDLHAVVRGCATASTSTSAATPDAHTHLLSTDSHQFNFTTTFSQDLYEPSLDSLIGEDLHDLPPAASQIELGGAVVHLKNSPISTLSVVGDPSSSEHHQLPIQPPPPPPPQQQQQFIEQAQQLTQKRPTFSVSNSLIKAGVSHNPSARPSKRRKINLKRVCHVPAGSLSSDMWSWRKYGQKPIKGSPYPRGYYKCSTLKGCPARKQVERNRSDPGMFIITYAGEHNHPMPTHRNSLAGCIRQKPAAPPHPDKPSHSPGTAPLLRTPEKLECSDLEDLLEIEDDDLSVSDMALDDDFLAGLEDLGEPDGGNHMMNDDFPESSQSPNCPATTQKQRRRRLD